MGSDASPKVLWQGVLAAREALSSHFELNVFASPEFCSSTLPPQGVLLTPASQVIFMHNDPMYALRRRHDSSLVRALKEHAKWDSYAVVTCANTGALVLGGRMFFPPFDDYFKPALLVNLPTQHGAVTLLDVGGNVDCTPENILQFANLGWAYCKKVREIENPTVALLNIGRETQKGPELHRQAFELLKNSDQSLFTFIGNIESRDLFNTQVDVVVCDGFSGNILLKTAEGVSLFILEKLEHSLKQVITPGLRQDLKKTFNYLEHPGGFLCGVHGHLIKCHGNGAPEPFAKSILYAAHLAENHAYFAISNQL